MARARRASLQPMGAAARVGRGWVSGGCRRSGYRAGGRIEQKAGDGVGHKGWHVGCGRGAEDVWGIESGADSVLAGSPLTARCGSYDRI